MTWQPKDTAPLDGTLIELRGHYHFAPDAIVEVRGAYETGGYTEGWATEGGAWFVPTHWRPIDTQS